MVQYVSASKLKGLASGYNSAWAKRLQDEQDDEDKQKIAQAEQKLAQQKQSDSEPWYKKAVDWSVKEGKNVVAGVEQGAGKVADVALEGGSLLGDIGQSDEGIAKNEATTEYLRNKLHNVKDINGNTLGGVQAADKAAQNIDSGHGSLKDAAEIAGTGLDVGLSATQFLNPTESLLQNAGKDVGEGIAKNVGESAAKQTTKDIVKKAAKDAAGYGVVGGASAGLDTYGETGSTKEALEAGIKGGLESGALQGGLEVGGSVAGKVIGRVRNGAPKETTPTSDLSASDEDITNIANDMDEAAKNPLRDVSTDDIQKQIQDFNDGKRSDNVEQDYAQQQDLRDELSRRERDSYYSNGGKTPQEAQQALDDFDNGKNLPDTVTKPAATVTSAEDIQSRDYLPDQLKQAAAQVTQDKLAVNQQLQGLMTPQAHDEQLTNLDDAYQRQIEELTRKYSSPERNPESLIEGGQSKVPNGSVQTGGAYTRDVRFITAKEKLDQEYKEAAAELDMQEAADSDEVNQINQQAQQVNAREQQLVLDSNNIVKQNPDKYRDIDQEEYDAQRQKLQNDVDTANRFGNPEQVVAEVANTPDPVKSFDRNPTAPEAFRSEVSKQVDELTSTAAAHYKSITGVKSAMLRILSPSRVLEKMGLRGEDLDLHSNILRAESGLNMANKADSEALTKIAHEIPNNKEAQAQIIDYIEGNRETLTAFRDKSAADDIKAWLDEKKAGLQKMGYKTMEDYFPHMFDKKDPAVQRLFKGKVTGEVSFGNLKQRLSNSDDYSRDIMDVLSQYASSYNRKAYLEPALKPLADLKTQVTLQDAESRWIDDYVNQLMGFDQSNIGKGFNHFMDGVLDSVGLKNQVGKNHFNDVLGTQRMISAAATMGLNPGTAIRNMTQMVNTVADIGPRYATIGAVDGTRALMAGKGSPEWAELQRAGIMEGGVSQNYFDAITKTGVRGKITKARDVTTKGLMSLIRATDVSLRAQAYYGAKALARDKGLVGKAAEDFAIRKTVDTQFITSRVDMPVAFNGQAMRSLTQLATFSAKQAGFLAQMGVKMVKGADGNGFRIQDMGSVVAAAATAWGATAALQPVIGMEPTEWIPFYDQIAPFFGADGDSLYRSPIVTLLAGDGKSKTGLIQALQEISTKGGKGIEDFINDNWSSVVPAGTQIKKTVEGLQTTGSGVSKNSSGDIRYIQNTDTSNKIKAGLFGQYATPNGQKWIQQGFPTLSDSQTKTAELQGVMNGPKAQEQYVDFYQAQKQATGRDNTYDAVKQALKDGDVNKATRLAKQYNDKLDQAMIPYWQKYDTMPKDLQDILDNKLHINVSKVDDTVKEEQ